MALGTNDEPDATAFASRIDELMTMAAGRRVLWVTVARAGWGALDTALIKAESKWPNLHVVDWRPVIAAEPAMQAGDGIHLTVEGYELRARFIAAAIETVGVG
jgi:lysophospholipase L1-like esterase